MTATFGAGDLAARIGIPWRYVIGDGVAVLTSKVDGPAVQALGGSGLAAYRRRLLCCDWSELGERQVFVTLTYPKDWLRFCGDPKTLAAHRKGLLGEWAGRWGDGFRGTWKVEFQDRGAPHVHAQCALPGSVDEDMWREIQDWTAAAIAEKRASGGGPKGRIAAMIPRFWSWGNNVWCRVVGSGGVDGHRMWGFQVRASFYTDRAMANARVEGPGGYLAKLLPGGNVYPVVGELAKGRQNWAVPRGFGRAKLWGFEGGFGPRVLIDEPVDPAVAMVLSDRIRAWLRQSGRDGGRWEAWGRLGAAAIGVDRWDSYSWLQDAERACGALLAGRDVERLKALSVL